MTDSHPSQRPAPAPGSGSDQGHALSAAAASSLDAAQQPRLAMHWIVNPPVDLLCFIGAAALGYGMFFLHAGLAMNMVTVWFVWYMFLDSPHFFATYSRTYLDREEMHNRKRLLLGSIALLGVGPVFIGLSYALYELGVASYKLPFLVLVGFVSTWAYWHVVRQHWGILALYKRKGGEQKLLDRRIDQWALYIGLLAPFVAFAVTNEGARSVLGLSAQNLDGSFTSTFIAGQGWESILVTVTQVIAALAIVLFIGRQAQRWALGEQINLSKVLFLAAVIPLHMVICYHPASTTLHILGFSACVTIFHDVQYHAIVWYYQKNRMSKAGDEKQQRYGMASRIGSSFPLYVVCAVGMGLTLGLLGCKLNVNPGCIPWIESKQMALFGTITLEEMFYSVFLGVLMHHYFVDQFIWRPSKDTKLQQDLKLQKQQHTTTG